MGTEARFQAMPEDCELMRAARQDREIAELIEFFESYATGDDDDFRRKNDPKFVEFMELVQQTVGDYPDLAERYFYAGARTYDAIVYLLSPARRAGQFQNTSDLIYQAMYGEERLHPTAIATQGHPIGLVKTDSVKVITDYLNQVTIEQFGEFYDAKRMYEQAVYKMHSTDNEHRFLAIWEEFEGMRDVYRAAADHDEAVIAIID
jgi:hypothetical protein